MQTVAKWSERFAFGRRDSESLTFSRVQAVNISSKQVIGRVINFTSNRNNFTCICTVVAEWRPRVSNYLLPRLSSTSDSQPRSKFLCKRQLNGRSREEGQHAHVAHDAFRHRQAGHLCATHRLCHGVRKILSQALKSKIQN